LVLFGLERERVRVDTGHGVEKFIYLREKELMNRRTTSTITL
jgi:hypothetical protein